MPIVTLFEHLKNTQKTVTFGVGNDHHDLLIKDVNIDVYDVNDTSLWFITRQGQEVKLNIEEFKEINFDAIVFDAKTSTEMISCLRHLEDSGKYNAYLVNKKGEQIIDFYNIPSK